MLVEVIKENKDFPVGTAGELIKENKLSYRVWISTSQCVSFPITLSKKYSKKCKRTTMEIAIEKHLKRMTRNK